MLYHLIRRNRNFALLWLSQIAADVATVLYSVGVMVTIYNSSGSVLQTVGVTVATTLPPFLLGPFSGPLVDRYPRRVVLICVHLLRVVAVLALTNQNLPTFYTVVVLLAIGNSFNQPARLAIVPEIVNPRRLVTANSLMVATLPASLAVGYLVGGVLSVAIGLNSVVQIVAAGFLLAVLLLLPLRLAPNLSAQQISAQQPQESLLTAARSGLRYLRGHAIAWPLTIMETFEHLPHGIWTQAIMLAFVERVLGGGAVEWGAQNAAFYLAMLIGSGAGVVVAARIGRRPGWYIIINAFSTAVLTLCYALSQTQQQALLLAFAFGIPFALRDVAQDALLQAHVANNMLGRVYAFRDMARNITFMAAGLGAAWLADRTSIRAIYVVGAVLYLLTALYILSNRAVRQSHI